ncbi:hypothetical protein ACX27_20595 [Nostoc piscinale CENA21]|uniref:Uncharacterized protein n=1 Tax=Nostoc piscinale CENA21 TaxID=224013 RepID=A0A0M4TYI7_9NOSO|nr:tetratricopeptide repeat protein [Nostoc piscinale]ALF54689.1 hypothetical protein ACX27_20595 [Nostoc piscinale CENA21]
MQFSPILATILLTVSSPTLALYYFSPSLAQAPTPTAEERITEAIMLNNQGEGLVYKDLVGLADLQAGLELFQQSLAIFKQYGAKAGEANSLVNIGYVYLRKGEYAKALDFLQSALDIRRKLRDKENEWIPLSYIAEVYLNLGDYQKALDFYQPALKVLQELKAANSQGYNYTTSETILLADIGSVYFRTGKYSQALDFYQQSLTIQKAKGDKSGTAQTLNNIGVVYLNLGNYAQALDSYQQGLKDLQECCSNFYGTQAAIFNNISGAYFSLGQYQKSLEFAEKSTNIYKKLGTGEYKSTDEQAIKLLYNALGQNAQALQQVTNRANVGDAFGKDSFQFQGAALNLNNIGQIYF